MRRIRATLLLAASALALALGLVPASAGANFVYWSNEGESTIGRAKLNGTGVNNSFIAGLNNLHGVAVDSKYVYWAQGTLGTSAIGRANLDGTGVNQALITAASGVDGPNGIAVTPSSIFWANNSTTIGRANLDGSGPVGNFISAPGGHCGIAADSNFVYWTDTIASNRIGRAPLDGSSSNPDFITGVSAECGVAVDASFIYWGTEAPLRSIGRAAIGGTGANNAFIPDAVASGLTCGVAVNPQYVFWSNKAATAIGQSKIGGGSPNPALAPGATNPCLLAAAPSNKVTVTSVGTNKKKGTAKIKAKVPGPGQLLMSTSPQAASQAATVKQVGLTLAAGGAFSVPVKPQGKASKQLKKKGKAKVTVYLNFTPSGVAGVTNPKKQVVKLVKKLKKKKKKKKKK